MRVNRLLLNIMLLAAIMLTLSGCWNRRELNELSVVMGMGLDATDEYGKLKVTAQIVKTGAAQAMEKGGVENKNKVYWNKVEYGYGLMQTLRGYTHEVSRKLYLPHNEVIVIGRKLAEEGMKDHIDFFLRDHETRFKVEMLVADGEAEEIFGLPSHLEAIPSFNLFKILEAQKNTSETLQVNMLHFICRMSSQSKVGTMPIVRAIDDGNEKVANVSGAAVFKDYKMIGELNETESRGMMWIMSKVKGGVLIIGAPGGIAEIEIINSKCTLDPIIQDDGSLAVNASLHVNCSLGSQTGNEDLAYPPNIKAVEMAIASKIKDEVNGTFRVSKEMKADVFKFSDEYYKHHPKEWEMMATKWEELYPTIILNMDVKVKLRGTGRITKPMYAD